MANNPEEVVWAKKPGFPRRQFTRRNLEAMGQDVNGDTYDGWKIESELEEPDEVKQAREQQAAEAKAKAEKQKAEKAASKEDSGAKKTAGRPKATAPEKADPTPVVPLNPDAKKADGAGDDSATKTDSDNGQIADNQETSAENGTEDSDLGGSATPPSGERD